MGGEMRIGGVMGRDGKGPETVVHVQVEFLDKRVEMNNRRKEVSKVRKMWSGAN